jgi:UDP-N-acetylglucosamine acyltransferase
VHQFSRLGAHAMIGAVSCVRSDVIPFGLAAGPSARLSGVNVVGMRRRKFSADAIRAVRSAYRMLFLGKDAMERRLEKVEAQFAGVEPVERMIAFIREAGKRPLCRAGKDQDLDD